MKHYFDLLRKDLYSTHGQRLWLQWVAVLYVGILVFGNLPGWRAQAGQVASGGVLHSLAYGGLTLLMCAGWSGSALSKASKAVLTVVLMGALDEYVQSFIPYRGSSVRDWLVDSASASVVAGIYVLVRKSGRQA